MFCIFQIDLDLNLRSLTGDCGLGTGGVARTAFWGREQRARARRLRFRIHTETGWLCTCAVAVAVVHMHMLYYVLTCSASVWDTV